MTDQAGIDPSERAHWSATVEALIESRGLAWGLANGLAARLETTTHDRDALLATCERYSEMRCDYFDGIPIACPGILADGFPCMACALRMAVVLVRSGPQC